MVEMKYFKSGVDSNFESNIEGWKWIIDVELSVIVTTTKVQLRESKEP
jgi:hypothetical protein